MKIKLKVTKDHIIRDCTMASHILLSGMCFGLAVAGIIEGHWFSVSVSLLFGIFNLILGVRC